MRVTTQMLNDSARRAGLPLDNSSVLDYVGGKGKNSSADSVYSPKNTAAMKKIKDAYDKQGKAADSMLDQIGKFASTDKDKASIFDKAKESGDTSDICKYAEGLVDDYNSLLDAMDKTTGLLDDFYKQNLKDIVSSNKDALAEIGITAKKDGTLNIDHDKLKNATVDKLEAVFGKGSEFMDKLKFLAGRISDNADANVKSTYSNYSAKGNMNYSDYLSNRFDFMG